MTEDRKRISLAIKIWWLYQQRYDEAKKWILRIVGDGEYAPDYRRLVREKNIPNVIFEGQDGVNGLLVKEGDCDGFVRKLHDLLSNDGERRRMAVSGLDVVNRFSVDRMMEQWMKILGGN